MCSVLSLFIASRSSRSFLVLCICLTLTSHYELLLLNTLSHVKDDDGGEYEAALQVCIIFKARLACLSCVITRYLHI